MAGEMLPTAGNVIPQTHESVLIMMADDCSPDVFLVEEALRTNGIAFQMDVCGTGPAAVRYVAGTENQDRKPDLFILDLSLPAGSGLEVLREIRGRSTLDGIPVALLTSSLSPREKAAALELKADAFLTKPTSLDEFLWGVGSALRDLIQAAR